MMFIELCPTVAALTYTIYATCPIVHNCYSITGSNLQDHTDRVPGKLPCVRASGYACRINMAPPFGPMSPSDDSTTTVSKSYYWHWLCACTCVNAKLFEYDAS